MVVVEMDSIIFRRNTRKGGRCMRGGALNTQNMILQQQKLNRFNKKIENMTRRKFHPRQIASEQKLRNEQKALVNKLKAKAATPVTTPVTTYKVNNGKNQVSMLTPTLTPTRANVSTVNTEPSQQVPVLQTMPNNSANLKRLINEARNVAKKLTEAANAVNATIKTNSSPAAGGNRRTQRK